MMRRRWSHWSALLIGATLWIALWYGAAAIVWEIFGKRRVTSNE